jgi:hypothetical protein
VLPTARHDQYEVISAYKIEEGIEGFDRPALLRHRQRQHAGGPAEADRRPCSQAPSIRPDVDSAPRLITEVKIDMAGMLGDADVDGALRTVKIAPALPVDRALSEPLQRSRRPGRLNSRSQPQNRLLRIGQVSRWPSTRISANAVPMPV